MLVSIEMSGLRPGPSIGIKLTGVELMEVYLYSGLPIQPLAQYMPTKFCLSNKLSLAMELTSPMHHLTLQYQSPSFHCLSYQCCPPKFWFLSIGPLITDIGYHTGLQSWCAVCPVVTHANSLPQRNLVTTSQQGNLSDLPLRRT